MTRDRLKTIVGRTLWFILVPVTLAVLFEMAIYALGLVRETTPWRILLTGAAVMLVISKVRRWLPWLAEPEHDRKGTNREAVMVSGTALVVAFLLRAYVVEPSVVPTGSMLPSLQIGDHVFTSKSDYGIDLPLAGRLGHRTPARGDVIVFDYPEDPDQTFIKRVVALPGDTVALDKGVLTINDHPAPRCEVGPVEYLDRDIDTLAWRVETGLLFLERLGEATYTTLQVPGRTPASWGPAKIPDGEVFVMGDNRDHSFDSRGWGTVPQDLIQGRAFMIWWSSGPPSHPLRPGRMGRLLKGPPLGPSGAESILEHCLDVLEHASVVPGRGWF